MTKFGSSFPAASAVGLDVALLRLAARMQAAERATHTAMDDLARAERRLSERLRQKGTARHPAWFIEATRKSQAAANALEKIYRQVARTRARTKNGMRIKLQLLASAYGGATDEADLVAVLISSLLNDVAG